MEIVVGRADDGGETRVFIEGVLDAVTVSDVRPALEAVIADQPQRLIVDLSRLRLIDSCGVGTLVAMYKSARARGCTFTVVGAAQQPLAILKLLNLDRVLGSSAIREAAPTPRTPTAERLAVVPSLVAVAS